MYNNWEVRCELVASREFAKAIDLYRTLSAIRSVSFSVKAARVEARSKLLSVPKHPVFSQDLRFPKGLYVDLTEGPAADAYAVLLSALDISERYADGSSDQLKRHDDSRVSFMQNLAALMRSISMNASGSPLNGIYTRNLLEESLEIEWEDNLVLPRVLRRLASPPETPGPVENRPQPNQQVRPPASADTKPTGNTAARGPGC